MRTIDPARGDHILETAARLFGERHYHEVRMEDVALAAGVAKGTLYRYFHDKEDLYQGLILSGSTRLYQEVGNEIAKTDEAEEKIRIYVNASLRFFVRCPYFLDLVQRVENSADPEKVEALHENRQRFFRLIAELIQHLIKTGKYATSRPDLAALALSGMIRQILRFHPQPFPPDLDRWIVNQFLHGLSAPASATNGHAPRRVKARAK